VNISDLKQKRKVNTSPVTAGDVSEGEHLCVYCNVFAQLVWSDVKGWSCYKCYEGFNLRRDPDGGFDTR